MGLISRRRVIATGVVILAGGGGVAVGATRRTVKTRRTPPQLLIDALAREQALLASLDAAIAADNTRAAVLTPLRTDHDAHRASLQALVDRATSPLRTSSAPSAAVPVLSTAQLATAERAAQAAGVTASAASTGALAALFASISACEAGHVALLS
jgi:hypothetical protein